MNELISWNLKKVNDTALGGSPLRGSPKLSFLCLPEVCEKMGGNVKVFNFSPEKKDFLEAHIEFECVEGSSTKREFETCLKDMNISYFKGASTWEDTNSLTEPVQQVEKEVGYFARELDNELPEAS